MVRKSLFGLIDVRNFEVTASDASIPNGRSAYLKASAHHTWATLQKFRCVPTVSLAPVDERRIPFPVLSYLSRVNKRCPIQSFRGHFRIWSKGSGQIRKTLLRSYLKRLLISRLNCDLLTPFSKRKRWEEFLLCTTWHFWLKPLSISIIRFASSHTCKWWATM